MNSLSDINSFLGIMQATIAPAMIISGLAFLLSIMASRYARCIDRTREILNMLDSGAKNMDDRKRKAQLYQLKIIYKRCLQLRAMMAHASLSVFLVVLTISTIFMGLLFRLHVEELAAIMFIFALLLLCSSMALFIRDIMISLYGIKVEIKDVEQAFEG